MMIPAVLMVLVCLAMLGFAGWVARNGDYLLAAISVVFALCFGAVALGFLRCVAA